MQARLQFLVIFMMSLFVVMHGSSVTAASLDTILASQPAQVKARYDARHPKATLEFFGIKPGMTVIEALPGRGWYSKILSQYLGPKGYLIGADYAEVMYPKFNFYDDAYLAKKKTWAKDWTKQAMTWHGDEGAPAGAFPFGSMTADLNGKVDAVLLIRALHNLARFENDGGYMSIALKEIHRALKPGGIVGVVQHQAPENAPDAWANGSNGYLKKSFVMTTLKSAGFEFVAESDININPKDQPVEGDIVWRLPPSYATSGNDAKLKTKYGAIGESTRMTLLFRKPK